MSSSISNNLYGTIRYGSSIYEGQVKKEEDGELVPEGFGIYRDPKEQYTGQYLDGEKSGYGELVLDDRVLTGSFGAQHRTGIIKYASGYEYKGSIAGNTPHGSGVMDYGNGDYYKGHFQTGRRHGWGTAFWAGCGKFSGLWENGSPANRLEGFWDFLPQRYVEMHNFNSPFNEWFIEHIFQIGEVKNGIFYGKKCAAFLNGDEFRGDYIGDEFLGTGAFYFAKEKMTYEGSFKNDSIWGKGTLTFENGRFIGEFERGKACGEGMVIYKNGDFFKGSFYSNLPQKGKIHWKNIGEYEGSWEEGKPDVNCDFTENYKKFS